MVKKIKNIYIEEYFYVFFNFFKDNIVKMT